MRHPPHVSHLFGLLPGAVLGMAGNARPAMVTASGSTLVRTVENGTAHQRDGGPASVRPGSAVRPAPRIRPAPPVRWISPSPRTARNGRPEQRARRPRPCAGTRAAPAPSDKEYRLGLNPWISSRRPAPRADAHTDGIGREDRRHAGRRPLRGTPHHPVIRASEDRSNAPLAPVAPKSPTLQASRRTPLYVGAGDRMCVGAGGRSPLSRTGPEHLGPLTAPSSISDYDGTPPVRNRAARHPRALDI